MSELEFHVGKCKKIDLNGLTIEEYCKQKCIEMGYKLNKWLDTYTKVFCSTQYGKYHVINNELYEVLCDKNYEDPYITEVTDNKDGTFNFVFGFYNGGTCFNEVLCEAIKNLKKNENNN